MIGQFAKGPVVPEWPFVRTGRVLMEILEIRYKKHFSRNLVLQKIGGEPDFS